MNLTLFLARRFLRGRGTGLLGTVATLALAGVALGAAALVVGMGLMSGYRGELAEKLAGTNAEVLVVPDPASQVPEEELKKRLRALPNVTAVARTAFAPGLVLSAGVASGADTLVKGLDVPQGLETTRLLSRVPGTRALFAAAEARGETPALLGAGLAARLGVGLGGVVVLETSNLSLSKGLSPPRRTLLHVVALLDTGFSEVDESWTVVPLAAFERFAPADARRIYELKLERASISEKTVNAAFDVLGDRATVLDWKSLNRDLFGALLLQQTLLFVALALIVAVAAGTVVSSLVVLLTEKTRALGVLAALGAPPRVASRVLRVAGLFLGGAGLLLGTGIGLVVCAVLTKTHAVRFPPEIAKVYYLSWMPFRPQPLDVAAILGIGFLLVLLASALPARRAARLLPADALRYE
ncbi:MAG: ABC transporter permease [Acidobacteria bacterium]|nr:ABC transporter permease [Acidobacteriota bacterium]